MAPPSKRRKLSESEARDDISFQSEVGRPAPTPTSSPCVEHLSHAYAASGPRQVPQRIEEVHLQIHHQALAGPENHHGLHRRQGTGVSSEPTLDVTVVAAVNTDGSTTGLSTTTDAVSASSVSSFASTATTTVISSSTPSDSTATSSNSDAASSTDNISSATSDSTSPTSSDNSTGSHTPTSSTSESSSTGIGLIGISATGATSTSASINGSSGAVSLTGTVTSLGTAASISQNLTTSELNSSTSRPSSHTTEASSQTLAAAFYLATLADGAVQTLSRASQSYITTFSDGSVATIPAATGSYVTTTGADGVTSVVYETTSAAGSGAEQSTITSIATIGGANVQGTATSSTTSSSTTGAALNGGSGGSNNTTAPPGTIAGGVVGGAAGLAVILLIAMLFLRYYRRRSQLGHQALPANAGLSPEPDHTRDLSRGPGMAERAGLMPALGAAVPALFRHSNRSAEGPAPSERSFTRVSGRKLPSSFSPGMSTTGAPPPPPPPPGMPLAGSEHNLSTTSFYRDSSGFYGGGSSNTGVESSVSPGEGAPLAAAGAAEALTLSPGPQRRPTVHTGGPYTMSSPPMGPGASSPTSPSRLLRKGGGSGSPPGTAGTAATFERSGTPSSLEGGRGSRFTEEV
ncbi:hypothetical protein LTR91_001238 [Friedmanniomyces endolithicus]|uniref:Uncharacterized protein n=1 Tax=Friedmanniomyces endolithicus TaxID=329885 RepID=A0AAN6L356_9PEZI|nr:hypothetical protein LTR35_012533 [Friedmanniomyces endolithicus]KAK0320347.1 hypothetical protein LTR82_008461 [Friedmanniomyces endolithicus]KAK0929722.1 hypothetical protein LTR57_001578 [Friedmanniomyces endolithicus]KAK1013087.1 hypothetical protein LTS01_000900 [Friedmanniomyces endolithicus]KAK1013642.1 hypothetical protein LTR91_001238 [Friedmanniomyces endolithicus]